MTKNGVVNGQGFRSAGKCERLEFDPRPIVSRKNSFTHYSIVCYEMRWIRTHAIHIQIRLEKLKFSGGIPFRIHQV